MVDSESLAHALGGGRERRQGSGWLTCCPAHDDQRPSLSVTGVPGGKLLVHCHAGCSQQAVVAALEERDLWPRGGPRASGRASRPGAGTATQPKGKERAADRGAADDDWTPVVPVPPDAPSIDDLTTCARATARYTYRDARGRVLFHVLRFDQPGGTKEVRPLSLWRGGADGKLAWRKKGLPSPHPLYRLDDLAARPEATVVVAEGEKAADAAARMLPEAVATTSPNGASNARRADWSPLAGRRVVVWPDADEAGAAYADDVAALAYRAGAIEVRIVELPAGLPTGWDLADNIPPWLDVRALIAAAPRVAKGMKDAEQDHHAPLDGPRADGAEDDVATPSEDALADRFVAENADRLRYCRAWRRWLRFDRAGYAVDDTGATEDDVRHFVRAVANGDPRATRRLCRLSVITAVAKLAANDRRVATSPDDWDAPRHVIATPDGIADLRDGVVRDATPNDLLTRRTSVAPARVADATTCTRWLRFIREVTSGDDDTAAFLQRAIGYCATGETTEQCMILLLGPGANGKSVLLESVARALGDLAVVAPENLMEEARGERHPAELMMLRGARLAIVSEVGRARWNAPRIKRLTGDSTVTARPMGGDFINFPATAKLVAAVNEPPQVGVPDAALTRRLRVVPLVERFDGRRRDHTLSARLKDEAPGILRWILDGAAAWYREGLGSCPAVERATADYIACQDMLRRFIGERCVLHPAASATVSALWGAWRAWCDDANESPGTKRRFTADLEAQGLERGRFGANRDKGFNGIDLCGDGGTGRTERTKRTEVPREGHSRAHTREAREDGEGEEEGGARPRTRTHPHGRAHAPANVTLSHCRSVRSARSWGDGGGASNPDHLAAETRSAPAAPDPLDCPRAIVAARPLAEHPSAPGADPDRDLALREKPVPYVEREAPGVAPILLSQLVGEERDRRVPPAPPPREGEG